MQVGAADAAIAHLELEVTWARLRLRDIHKLHPTDGLKRNSLHGATLLLGCARIMLSAAMSVKGRERPFAALKPRQGVLAPSAAKGLLERALED